MNFVLRGTDAGIVDLEVDNKKSGGLTDQVIKLKTRSLGSVLEENHVSDVIDYFSIDVEGSEERILSGFDFQQYTFRTITIERPTMLLRDLFKAHGYIFIMEIPDFDCFYVHKDFYKEYIMNLFKFCCKKHLKIRLTSPFSTNHL